MEIFLTGIGFFVVLGILALAIGILSENNREGWATTLFVSIIVLTGFRYDWDLSIITENWLSIVIGFFAYLLIGTGWSIFKWYLYIRKEVTKFKKFTADYILYLKKNEKWKGDLTHHFEDFKSSIKRNYRPNGSDAYGDDLEEVLGSIAPSAAYNKAKITSWIAFFPVSALWTLINDPVVAAVTFIYENVSGSFQKLSERMFKNALK